MIRNSTHKYREKYQKSLPKNPQGTTSLHSQSAATLPNPDFDRTTLSYITQLTSYKTLGPQSKSKPANTADFNTSSKLSELKLSKKSAARSPKIEQITKEQSSVGQTRQTAASKQINNQRIKEEMKVSNSQKFIEELPKNSLFFCCKCYQYVFQIEKKRHYPDCKDAVDLTNRKSNEFQKMADRRIKNIVQLARYTGVKAREVEELYLFYEGGNLEEIVKIPYSTHREFFTLQQIVTAFCYTFGQLLKGVAFHQESGIFNCF